MRYLLFILILFACNQPVKVENKYNDSIGRVEAANDIDSIKKYANIKAASYQDELTLDSANRMILTYQNIIKNQQPDEVELQTLKHQIIRLRTVILKLRKHSQDQQEFIDVLYQHNSMLKDSNETYVHKLRTQQEHIEAVVYEKHRLKLEKEELQQKIDNSLPTIIKQSCRAVYFNIFNVPKQTTKAKYVTRIEVRFTIVPNSLNVKKYWEFTVTLNSNSKYNNGVKQTFKWNAGENPEIIRTFDAGYFPGTHTVNVAINNQNVYEGTIKLN